MLIDLLKLFLSRIPNIVEVLISVTPQTALELWFDEHTEKLNNDPISKGIFREATGVPVNILNVLTNTEVSQTGIRNDWISSGGGLLQTSCKFSYIYPVLSNETSSNKEVEQASVFASYVCSPISSILNVVSKERQVEKNTHIFAIEYILFNFKAEWIIKSFLGSIATTYSVSNTVKFVKYLDYYSLINNFTNNIENKIIVDVLHYPTTININDNVWSKIKKLHDSIDCNDFSTGDAVLLGTTFTSKFIINAMNTYVIATMARFGLACFEILYKEQPLFVLFNVAIFAEQTISDYLNDLYNAPVAEVTKDNDSSTVLSDHNFLAIPEECSILVNSNESGCVLDLYYYTH